MPTIRTRGPAARRTRFAITLTFFSITATPDTTHPTGSGARTHAVMSLPPIDTVTSAVLRRLLRRKRSAAASWVVPGYARPPGPSARGGHPLVEISEAVVAPPQPKFTSLSR